MVSHDAIPVAAKLSPMSPMKNQVPGTRRYLSGNRINYQEKRRCAAVSNCRADLSKARHSTFD